MLYLYDTVICIYIYIHIILRCCLVFDDVLNLHAFIVQIHMCIYTFDHICLLTLP